MESREKGDEALVAAIGEEVGRWARRCRSLVFTPDDAELEPNASRVGRLIAEGWEWLGRLPFASRRNAGEAEAGERLKSTLFDLQWRFCRAHRRPLYDRLTSGMTAAVRADDLVYRAAELWPGLVPTRSEVAAEAERMQADKDGREILQGLFLSQMLSDPIAGDHLVQSMLRPLPASEEALDAFVRNGRIELETVHLETKGEVGFVTFHRPRYLNAEDDETRRDQEIAIDLVLLHPGLRMGVLRGGPVEHPKYKGRRIFSAGINLTKIYQGKISYLFYLLRDLGLVNKIFRGLVTTDAVAGEPETTLEKPWVAVMESFAIGGGCQLLLVVDYVLAESGSYFSLPARKEGIIPGTANLRLPRFLGERLAREAVLFDRSFQVEEREAGLIVNEVHPAEELEAALERKVELALGSGMVSAAGNRKALRVQSEPLDLFRQYMATYAREQAFCHFSHQLVKNLEKHWQAKRRTL